jgi:nucleoside-diphosphate-sugar epimerase
VYGPRFYWATDFIKSLKDGTAAWVDEGKGVFNGIYVDNLVHAIEQALIKPGDAQVFLVNDNTYTRWRDFLIPLAKAAGMGPGDIKNWQAGQCHSKAYAYWESLRGSKWVQHAAACMPSWMKQGLKAGVQASLNSLKTLKALRDNPQPSSILDIGKSTPQGYMSYEMELLQSTQWKLPNKKAQELLDYKPPYTFEEGMDRTLAWLRFARYTKE